MDTMKRVQILDESVCISPCVNTPGKNMYLPIVSSPIRKIVEQTGIFILGKKTYPGEE